MHTGVQNGTAVAPIDTGNYSSIKIHGYPAGLTCKPRSRQWGGAINSQKNMKHPKPTLSSDTSDSSSRAHL